MTWAGADRADLRGLVTWSKLCLCFRYREAQSWGSFYVILFPKRMERQSSACFLPVLFYSNAIKSASGLSVRHVLIKQLLPQHRTTGTADAGTSIIRSLIGNRTDLRCMDFWVRNNKNKNNNINTNKFWTGENKTHLKKTKTVRLSDLSSLAPMDRSVHLPKPAQRSQVGRLCQFAPPEGAGAFTNLALTGAAPQKGRCRWQAKKMLIKVLRFSCLGKFYKPNQNLKSCSAKLLFGFRINAPINCPAESGWAVGYPALGYPGAHKAGWGNEHTDSQHILTNKHQTVKN